MLFKDKIRDLYYFSSASILAQRISRFCIKKFWGKRLHIEYIGAKPDNSQNCILVSNHRSYSDPPLMGIAAEMPTAFVAKKELFSNPFLYLYMILTSTISVDRENPETQTFRAVKKALSMKQGKLAWAVGVFIEGTRSKLPDTLAKPNKGPIFMAKTNRVPILPIGISYRGKEIYIKIGEAYNIDPKRDLEEQAWECLHKISLLCDYKMPEFNQTINEL